MYTKGEKLSLLSEMIALAKSDKELKENEYGFILAVASQLGVSENEVADLMKKKVEKKILQPEAQRILQFHRLVLLMNVDQESALVEIEKIREIGLSMGLRREAIDTVLKEMHSYKDKVIPPNELIEIFKRFYN
ncbi:TerB family tellurite resistance protein [Aquimarina sp. TRL1]|uniref:TerB family tellurite resistance protein n=1 Tax=Aquimarina sp. (strain TRL1) TaxID=2736252 RepID=UPI00158A9A86|nr:TerB family tellurite resistance protein [Aquimarina sp. TRL1]QKX05703.1 TerB family tellurite resistance protein [Aquimarina sp. TRL1]